MKCLEVNLRQYLYCLQNLGIIIICIYPAYSFSPLHEMPDIFRHLVKCLTSQIACNTHTHIYIYTHTHTHCMYFTVGTQPIISQSILQSDAQTTVLQSRDRRDWTMCCIMFFFSPSDCSVTCHQKKKKKKKKKKKYKAKTKKTICWIHWKQAKHLSGQIKLKGLSWTGQN